MRSQHKSVVGLAGLAHATTSGDRAKLSGSVGEQSNLIGTSKGILGSMVPGAVERVLRLRSGCRGSARWHITRSPRQA